MKENRDMYAAIWAKAEAAVDGKPCVSNYLYPYPAEDADKYTYRLQNSSYQNLPNAILLRWSQIFTKSVITIDAKSTTSKMIADNIDNKGGNTSTLAKEIFEDIAIYGSAWLLIDLPEWEDKPNDASEADRLSAGILPYVSCYSQPNIIDWNFNRYNRLDYVVVRTKEKKQMGDKVLDVYAEYGVGYKQKFVLIASAGGLQRANVGSQVEISVNGHPYMPFIVGGLQKYKSDPDFYNSPMNSIVDTSLELYNRSSANGAAYDKVGFAFLAIGESSNVDQLGLSSLVKVTLGEITPQYVQPESTCFEQYRLEIQRLIDTVFSLAGMKNRAVTSDAAKSGTALKLEDATSYNMVSLISKATEDLINKAWTVLLTANGTPNDVVGIQFPDSYDFDSLQTELENLKLAAELENDALFISLFSNVIKRKISDTDEQKKIIAEEASKTKLRISNSDSGTLELLIKEGVISKYDLVRTLCPAHAQDSDTAILKWIEENKNNVTVDNVLE